jgi:hypothetical protein
MGRTSAHGTQLGNSESDVTLSTSCPTRGSNGKSTHLGNGKCRETKLIASGTPSPGRHDQVRAEEHPAPCRSSSQFGLKRPVVQASKSQTGKAFLTAAKLHTAGAARISSWCWSGFRRAFPGVLDIISSLRLLYRIMDLRYTYIARCS